MSEIAATPARPLAALGALGALAAVGAAFCAALGIALGATPAGAQLPNAPAGMMASQYKVDLAIPDAPATALVAVDASQLSRPSTTRELAASVSGFTGAGGRVTLPATAGLEIAPRLLFGATRLSIADYRANAVLSRLRVSGAVRRATTDGAPSDFAIGVRTSLVDRSDPHTDARYVADVDALLTRLATLRADRLADSLGARECTTLACLRSRDSTGIRVVAAGEAYAATLDALRRRVRQFEDSAWNRLVWDVAAAARGRAAPTGVSAGESPTAQEYAAWTLLGVPLGGGQAVLGARGTYARDSAAAGAPFAWRGMIGARVYAGANQYKAFVEGQSVFRAGRAELLLNGGAEVRLIDSFWAVFSAGYLVPTGEARSRFVSSLKLRVAPPAKGAIPGA